MKSRLCIQAPSDPEGGNRNHFLRVAESARDRLAVLFRRRQRNTMLYADALFIRGRNHTPFPGYKNIIDSGVYTRLF